MNRQADRGQRSWLSFSLRRTVGPNVLFLGLVSLLNDMSSEMIYPVLPVFLTTVLGVNMAFVGLIEGAAESATSFFKLGSGWISDRFGRRKPLVLGGYSLSALSRPFLAISSAGWHVLALRLGDRTGKGVRTAPRDALIAESVNGENLGVAFGFHRAMDHAGAVAGPLLAMVLIALLGENLRLIFLLAALPGLAAAGVVLLRVKDITRDKDIATPTPPRGEQSAPALGNDSASPRSGTGGHGAQRGPGAGGRGCAPDAGTHGGQLHHGARAEPDGTHRWPRGSRGYRPPHAGADCVRGPDGVADSGGPGRLVLRSPLGVFLLAVALFSLGNSTDAFLLLRANDLGVPLALLPAVWVLLSAVKALSSAPAGYLADRVGRRKVLLAGWAVYVVTYLGFAAASSAGAVVALFAFYGLYFGLAEGTEKALVAQLASAARGTAYGLYHLAVGVTALPASLLFGLVWERLGPEAAFVMGAALALTAAMVLLAVRAGARGPWCALRS